MYISYLTIIFKLKIMEKKPKNNLFDRKFKKTESQSKIIVNHSQSNNPLIKSFFFKYSFSQNIKSDFQLNNCINCYFLSLRYHQQYPTYISSRLQLDPLKSTSRYLLCYYDINPTSLHQNDKFLTKNFKIIANLLNENTNEDNIFEISNKTKERNEDLYSPIENMLIDINLMCIDQGVNFILCFSNGEVAQYLYSLSLMGSNLTNNLTKKNLIHNINNDDIINSLCYIDGINKNDASNLLTYFKDIKSICGANDSLLSLVPKMNQVKINQLKMFFNYEIKKEEIDS